MKEEMFIEILLNKINSNKKIVHCGNCNRKINANDKKAIISETINRCERCINL
jgi:hypothetical protein